MDNTQIHRLMKVDPLTSKNFQGCFPIDCLPPDPSTLPSPFALIINLSPAMDSGSHWVALYSPAPEKKAIYFDSLALKPKEEVEEFLRKFPQGYVRNKHPFQCHSSDVCAHYCLTFIYFLSHGFSFDQFLGKLNKNCTQSDLFVHDFVEDKLMK